MERSLEMVVLQWIGLVVAALAVFAVAFELLPYKLTLPNLLFGCDAAIVCVMLYLELVMGRDFSARFGLPTRLLMYAVWLLIQFGVTKWADVKMDAMLDHSSLSKDVIETIFLTIMNVVSVLSVYGMIKLINP